MDDFWPPEPDTSGGYDPERHLASRAYRPAYFLRRLLEIKDIGTTPPRVFDIDSAIARKRVEVLVALELDRRIPLG